ncbi:MAG: hypothetical protein WDM77_02880 [Steroidobacteraceae bacterium]
MLIQFAAHEHAALTWVNGCIKGPNRSVERVGSLVRFALIWFSLGGGVLAAILIVTGHQILGSVHVASPPHLLMLSWSILAVVTGFNLVITAICNVLEGLALVSEVAVLRIIQYVLGGGAAVIGAANRMGLLVPVLQSATFLLVGVAYLLLRRRRFLVSMWRISAVHKPTIRWTEEVLPFQWRIAVSWLSGYAVSQLMILVIFTRLGPPGLDRRQRDNWV